MAGRFLEFLCFRPRRSSFDEVRIWQRALTEQEIQQRLNLPIRGNESDLVTYWRFDEGTGGLAYDSAALGGRANGTLAGRAAFVFRPSAAQNGLLGTYFNSTALFGDFAVRVDSTVDFNVGGGQMHPAIPPDFFRPVDRQRAGAEQWFLHLRHVVRRRGSFMGQWPIYR